MQAWLKHCWQGTRWCSAGVLGLVRWTLWLALCLLLGVQAWIAGSHELAVPGFVLRLFEQRLAASHVEVKFGHARFDPSGRILLEDLRLFLPAYGEPIAATPAAYLELDPWALLSGKFEPHRLHLSGTRFAVPAMLSRSGRAEDFVRELDATLRLQDHELVIEHLTARVAGIAVVARGSLHLLSRPEARLDPLPLPGYLAAHYPDICRQLIRLADRLTGLDQPELRVDLTPSPTRGAIATVTVVARGLQLATPVALTARGLHLTTRFPLQGDTPVMAPLTLAVEDLALPGDLALHDVHAWLRGSLQPAQYTFDPREMLLSSARVSARGFTLTGLAARLEAGPLPRLQGELVAACDGQRLALRGEADLGRQTAGLQFQGALSPALLEPIGRALRHDLRPYVGFASPVALDARATFAPGWTFTGLTGPVLARQVDAFHVPIDEVGGAFEFDGTRFLAREAHARLGDNRAEGSFEQDFSNRSFRFLLAGRLRPLAISGWFGKWWPGFFRDFEFPLAPPEASVDVAGVWGQGRLTTVFAFADSTAPVIHGVSFDHARTLLFIRPNFFDGLELFATLGSAAARGTFTRQIDPGSYALIGMDLDFTSTLPLEVPARVFGPAVAEQLAPFRFSTPPAVKLQARFDGPASPTGVHQTMQIQAQSSGEFSFHGFPLSNLAVQATLHDDEVVLRDVAVNFASGVARGQARVWGREPDRRLGFDLALRDGSLGQAVRVMEEFSAQRHGVPPPPPGKFVHDKAGVKLGLAASAEGRYSDPYSYRGHGYATVEGATLGEVPMLGLLSELLPFTSLRFTTARANFTVDGPSLIFAQFNATGANSAIDAHGRYDLPQHTLDFKARVNPFQESKFLPSVVIGAMLMPFATVLEVKLTGTLDKPAWDFVNGPTNFLRNLAKPSAPPSPAKPAAKGPPADYLRR